VQITAVKNYVQKNTAIYGELIKAVYVSYFYVYVGILLRCAYQKTTVSI